MDHFDNAVAQARLLAAPSTSYSPRGQALPSSPPSGSPLVLPLKAGVVPRQPLLLMTQPWHGPCGTSRVKTWQFCCGVGVFQSLWSTVDFRSFMVQVPCGSGKTDAHLNHLITTRLFFKHWRQRLVSSSLFDFNQYFILTFTGNCEFLIINSYMPTVLTCSLVTFLQGSPASSHSPYMGMWGKLGSGFFSIRMWPCGEPCFSPWQWGEASGLVIDGWMNGWMHGWIDE